MALRIELWTETGLAGGLEQWWDDVDIWLDEDAGERRLRYPILGSFDPYGLATIPESDFRALWTEVVEVASGAPTPVASVAAELAALCEQGLEASEAELRLVGD